VLSVAADTRPEKESWSSIDITECEVGCTGSVTDLWRSGAGRGRPRRDPRGAAWSTIGAVVAGDDGQQPLSVLPVWRTVSHEAGVARERHGGRLTS
jgi:hypothetical protein